MKKTTITLVLIILLTGCAPMPNLSSPEKAELAKNNYNFMVDNGDLVWQQVYSNTENSEQLINSFIKSGIFESYNSDENSLFGELKPFGADYKGAGYSEMTTPIYIARSFFGGHCVIEFKRDRYRVTLTDVYAVQKYTDPLSQMGEVTEIEAYSVNGNSFKNIFMGVPAYILNYSFNEKFKIDAVSEQW